MELLHHDCTDSNKICAALLVCTVCVLKQNVNIFVAVLFIFPDSTATLSSWKLLQTNKLLCKILHYLYNECNYLDDLLLLTHVSN
jgi:hypothetical protein